VPAKPAWYTKIVDVVREIESLPRPFVDRATLEFLLGVGRRRAQQIMAPCITHRVGSNGLADRDALVAHLRRLARDEDVYFEKRRRQQFAEALARLRQERLDRPRLLVEAPAEVTAQEFANLPPGVRLEPGRITVDFDEPHHALEKLLALAMAISNDHLHFERITGRRG
jgi:hypothetical protein